MFKFSEEFQKVLERWLEKPTFSDAEWLQKNKSEIPSVLKSYDGYLYRGMVVNKKFIDDIKIKSIKFTQPSTWSKNSEIAKNFINDEKYKFAKTYGGGTKILLKKKILNSDQILDIHACVMLHGLLPIIDEISLDNAFNEAKVLVSNDIEIEYNDIEFI